MTTRRCCLTCSTATLLLALLSRLQPSAATPPSELPSPTNHPTPVSLIPPVAPPRPLRATPHPGRFILSEQWQALSTSIEVKEVIAQPNALFPSRILFARIPSAHTELRVLSARDYGYPQLTAREIAIHSGAILTINANFFDEKGDPLGVVLSGGTLKHRPHRSGRTLSGIFQVKAPLRNIPSEIPSSVEPPSPGLPELSIIHRDIFTPERVLEAIQAGPRLVIAGTPAPGVRDTVSTRRAGICIATSGDIIVFCVSSGLFAVDMRSLQELLVSPAIGCSDALNLDGGGSAQLYVRSAASSQSPPGSSPTTAPIGTIESAQNSPMSEITVEGLDRVPIFIGFFEKKGPLTADAPVMNTSPRAP